MRRIAAHYIFWKKLLPLHYIELGDDNTLIGVFPLNEEIAGTEFKDGVIFPSSDDQQEIKSVSELEASGITDAVKTGSKVVLNQIIL